MKKLLLIIFIVLGPFYKASAGFYIQHSFNYETESESAEKLEYSLMRNIVFLGAQFGKSGQWIIGQSVILWDRSVKNNDMASASTVSLTELGPRFQYFLNESKTFYVSAVYNFYVKGTRNSGGNSQDVSGTSYLLNMGTQLKVNKKFYFGISLNYHSVSLSEKTVGTTTTTITDTHSYIFPAMAFSLRFK